MPRGVAMISGRQKFRQSWFNDGQGGGPCQPEGSVLCRPLALLAL